ncbi:chitobiosyldiphosphodolichol beta-mannosyltransferase [Sarracenia purpurea var. burkii]
MRGHEEANIGRRGRAAVVVLGDIGRSPRMQYHALSLARQVCLEVDIVVYGESTVCSNFRGYKMGKLAEAFHIYCQLAQAAT